MEVSKPQLGNHISHRLHSPSFVGGILTMALAQVAGMLERQPPNRRKLPRQTRSCCCSMHMRTVFGRILQRNGWMKGGKGGQGPWCIFQTLSLFTTMDVASSPTASTALSRPRKAQKGPERPRAAKATSASSTAPSLAWQCRRYSAA